MILPPSRQPRPNLPAGLLDAVDAATRYRIVQRLPLAQAVLGMLQSVLEPTFLEDLFQRCRGRAYCKSLSFTTLVHLGGGAGTHLRRWPRPNAGGRMGLFGFGPGPAPLLGATCYLAARQCHAQGPQRGDESDRRRRPSRRGRHQSLLGALEDRDRLSAGGHGLWPEGPPGQHAGGFGVRASLVHADLQRDSSGQSRAGGPAGPAAARRLVAQPVSQCAACLGRVVRVADAGANRGAFGASGAADVAEATAAGSVATRMAQGTQQKSAALRTEAPALGCPYFHPTSP